MSFPGGTHQLLDRVLKNKHENDLLKLLHLMFFRYLITTLLGFIEPQKDFKAHPHGVSKLDPQMIGLLLAFLNQEQIHNKNMPKSAVNK